MKSVSSKSLKYFVYSLFLILGITIFGSCSKDDDPLIPSNPNNPTEEVVPDSPEDNPFDEDETDTPEETLPEGEEEMYEAYYSDVQDIYEMIDFGLISCNEELKEVWQNNVNVTSIEEDNGIMYVNFRGDWQFMADFQGNGMVKPGDPEDFDEKELENLLKEWEEFEESLYEGDNSSTYLTRSFGLGNSNIIASKFKILLWNPYGYSTEVEFLKYLCDKINSRPNNISARINIQLDIKSGNECSLSDLRNFNSYDIIIFSVHGNRQGTPAVPVTMNGVKNIKGNYGIADGVKSIGLDQEILTSYLPDLKNNVLWTLMCYSLVENGSLLKAAQEKSAGDYFGSDKSITAEINFNIFSKFLINLYRGASSHDALNYGKGLSLSYSGYSDSGNIEGIFGTNNCFNGICFPLTYVKQETENKLIGYWQAPVKELDKVLSGIGKFKAGVELTNKETGKKSNLDLLNANIEKDKIERKSFRNIVEGIKVEFKTDDFAEGKYSYQTYIIYPDGNKKYSENQGSLRIENIPEGNCLELTVDYEGNVYSGITLFSLEGNDIEITKVVCEDANGLSGGFSLRKSYDQLYLSPSNNPKEGIYYVKCYYKGELKSFIDSEILGGKLPDTVERIGKLKGNTKMISTSFSGDDIITIPITLKDYVGGYNSLLELKTLDFSGCTSLSSIGDNAFYKCINLTSVSFSGCTSLSVLGENAFCQCSNLTSVNFSGCTSLSLIRKYAFYQCSNLTSVNFSGCNFLTSLEESTFSQCSNLTSVNFSGCAALTTIGEVSFFDCSNLTSVNFSGCSALSLIGNYAFEKCKTLPSVNLSGCTGLTSIGDGAFYQCSNLSSVNFSGCSALSNIGDYVFSACRKISNVNFSGCSVLSTLGKYAFSGCINLFSINFSGLSSLTTIEDYAFSECSNLSTINFSSCSSLSTIGNNAFQYCNSLKSVNFDNTKIHFISEDPFKYCDHFPKKAENGNWLRNYGYGDSSFSQIGYYDLNYYEIIRKIDDYNKEFYFFYLKDPKSQKEYEFFIDHKTEEAFDSIYRYDFK